MKRPHIIPLPNSIFCGLSEEEIKGAATPEDAFSGEELKAFNIAYNKTYGNKKEPTNNNKLEEDIKLLKNCISNTDVPKSIFKKEIDNLKNKLNEVSNKLFTKKVKKTIKGINKTNIKSKSEYDPEKFTEGKNTIAQIEARLQDNNLMKNHKLSTKVKIMKKTGYEHEIKALSPEGKDYVNEVMHIVQNSKVSGGKRTKDLKKAKAKFHYNNKLSDAQNADAVVKKYMETLPDHVPEPGKRRGKGKKTVIKSPEDKARDTRHKNIVKYIKNKIDNKEFEQTYDETINFMADDAIKKGIKRMSILIIE